jgi:plasmid stabilization system protein ParE
MPSTPQKVIWSERATREYLSTLAYVLQEWGEAAAEKVETSVFHTIDRMARTPEQFPLVHLAKQIRKGVVTYQNSIFFREREGHIEILSFFDTRQNPDKLDL